MTPNDKAMLDTPNVSARYLDGARRLVVKVGSALLVDEASGAVRRDWLWALADDLAALRAVGKEVLVVSSGAIAVGRRPLGLSRGKLKLEQKLGFFLLIK